MHTVKADGDADADISRRTRPPYLQHQVSIGHRLRLIYKYTFYIRLGKPNSPWRFLGPNFALEAALMCQALPLSKRPSLWSGWVGQKRVSG